MNHSNSLLASEPAAAQTTPQMLSAAAARWPLARAMYEPGHTLTYAGLDALRWQATRALMASGIERGDRVAIWAPNSHQWIAAALAIHSAGAVLVPVNTRLRGIEAGGILADSGARLLFCAGDFLGEYYPALLDGHRPATLEKIVVLGTARPGPGVEDWFDFLARAHCVRWEQAAARAADVKPGDLSDVMFTSGTTGRPKGVMAAHGQNLRAIASWGAAVGLQPGERYLIVSPFFHAFGYKAGWLAALMHGCTIAPHQVFDAQAILERIAAERIHVLPGPPTLYLSMLAHPQLAQYDLSSLRAAVTGAAAIAPSLIERMRKELGFRTVLTGYGLTESCGFATLCDGRDTAELVATTCGRPMPGVELRCADAEGHAVPPGVAGEVQLRGYNVMQGYFNDGAATARALTEDGWLRTGDIGVIDEQGYLRITDRLGDMYICGGFNCYPAEIERLLAAHPAIAQVAVIGVPDERMGEVGKACIVLRPGASLAEGELIAWARGQMANYKVPRAVDFLDALPQNASGKVLKFQLKQSAPA
ncbi:3-((3aS,4S,7aS)-7a-methyl-1,5-dioxo-octahydro-1H- inden-4-yl)propanoate--CoA ligase FadD3 [Pseudoduganella ginsengisoli]|uniref:AMP-binding protein n=1 Tax=Pseudoduganella ginsengisoli TaxID=1462440 RepID=A0A6L6PW34_9BURK|nr:FadD3 family acyl-CoA ligase [Pseudoduganella ginsengisoli]MTW01645.1 AMP-binding protein [Pseudoduganella ginsengisoli]